MHFKTWKSLPLRQTLQPLVMLLLAAGWLTIVGTLLRGDDATQNEKLHWKEPRQARQAESAKSKNGDAQPASAAESGSEPAEDVFEDDPADQSDRPTTGSARPENGNTQPENRPAQPANRKDRLTLQPSEPRLVGPRLAPPNQPDELPRNARPIRSQRTPSDRSRGSADGSGDAQASQVHRATLVTAPSGIQLIQQAYDESRAAESERQYSSVITLCEQGIQAGVSEDTKEYAQRLMSWALNRRGQLRAGRGDEEGGLADFEAAVQYDKTRWRAFHNRGVSLALAGRHDEAIADFTRTIELNPKYAKAFSNRAELLLEQDKSQDALTDFERAIRLAPDDSMAYNGRGLAYYRLGKYRYAVRDLTKALQLDPKNAAAFVNRGKLYGKLGYYARALRDFQHAVDSDPELGRAYQGAAWILATCPDEKYRDAEQAVAAASRAIELDGDDDPVYLDTLAAAHARAGRFDMAQDAIVAALERTPEMKQKELVDRLTRYEKKETYESRPIELASRPQPTQSAIKRR